MDEVIFLTWCNLFSVRNYFSKLIDSQTMENEENIFLENIFHPNKQILNPYQNVALVIQGFVYSYVKPNPKGTCYSEFVYSYAKFNPKGLKIEC